MRKYVLPLVAALLAAALTAGLAIAGDGGGDSDGAYAIGFWGDLPYSEEQKAGVRDLIADMNRQPLAFSVHAGDIKSGSSRCDNKIYDQAKGYFNALEAPAMYTPGDNEWTDCDRPSNGAHDSEQRLKRIRRILFDTQLSFGQRPIPLESQGPPMTRYTENRRWQMGGVVYATLHVVGSNNNLGDVAPDPEEWRERDEATNRWMHQTFDIAERANAPGILLVVQANPGFDKRDTTRAPARDPQSLAGDSDGNGFDNFMRTLRERTKRFRKPVALVHGDSHYFRLDKPLQDDRGGPDPPNPGPRIENFTRLEPPGNNAQNGNNDTHWVKVLVDPDSREVFSYQPQTVPQNRTAVPPP